MNNFVSRAAISKYSISINDIPTSNFPTKWQLFIMRVNRGFTAHRDL